MNDRDRLKTTDNVKLTTVMPPSKCNNIKQQTVLVSLLIYLNRKQFYERRPLFTLSTKMRKIMM